jgi:sorbose reductase
MARRGTTGSLILIASISAHIINFPQPQVHYNTGKASILSIKSLLAAKWAKCDIHMISTSPDYIDTILNEGNGPAEHRATWAQQTPYRRMGESKELTGAIILLASKAGSYITGSDILIDGEISIY